METNHIGNELNNVRETWDQNEKRRANPYGNGPQRDITEDLPPTNELDLIIRQEAAEYDNENKENRILGGDRATVNDDQSPQLT